MARAATRENDKWTSQRKSKSRLTMPFLEVDYVLGNRNVGHRLVKDIRQSVFLEENKPLTFYWSCVVYSKSK